MTKHRRLRAAVALALVASLAGACSVSITDKPATEAGANGGGNTNGGGGSASGPDFSGAPVRGVTEDTIKIGAAVLDTQAIKDTYGVDIGNLPKEGIPALVDELNEAGGINGRQIELVTRYFMPIGTDPSEQACRELIEDEQVFAVIGTFLADNPLCVTETYSTPYIGLWGLNTERRQRSLAPFLTVAAEEEEGTEASIDLLVENGAIDGATVGIYFEPGTTQQAIDERIIAPLEEAGIKVVGSAQLPNTGGDAVQAASEFDRILQRFESDGADTVIFASSAGVVMPGLERTSWEPQLVFVNNGQILGHEAAIRYGLTDPAELVGAIGAVNGLTSAEKAEDEHLAECFATISERTDLDIEPDDVYAKGERAESQEMAFLAEGCLLWQFTAALLTAAGDDPTPQALIDGLADIELDLQFNAGASLSAERWGAKEGSRLWTYDEDQVTFVPLEDEGQS